MKISDLISIKPKYVNFERQYLQLLEDLYDKSTDRPPRMDRTEVGCHSIFGRSFHIDLREEFLVLTTKSIWWDFIVEELLWFLSGSTNVGDLPANMRHLWSPWCSNDGDLGPIYGHQFTLQREEDTLPQFIKMVKRLHDDPNSRRHVMTTWDYLNLDKMGLSPCHGTVIQFFVEDGWLDLTTYQRSQDVLLGGPFNIPSYSLLLHIVAGIIGKVPRNLHYHLGDAHMYHNHKAAVLEQLGRKIKSSPQLNIIQLPTMHDLINLSPTNKTIGKWQFELKNYNPHPAIKAPLAI